LGAAGTALAQQKQQQAMAARSTVWAALLQASLLFASKGIFLAHQSFHDPKKHITFN
jgi:hypothetical protein